MKLTLICILLGQLNIAAANVPPDSSKARPGYADSLKIIVGIYKAVKVPSIKQIAFCIPENAKESNIFFQLDYEKQSENEFSKLLDDIERLCMEGEKSVIRKFIVLSNFVDGYFAEDYFDSADKIYKERPDVFCMVFSETNESKTTRLRLHGVTCKE